MCTIILQKKVCRVSFLASQKFLNYVPSRFFLLLCSPRLIFFGAFVYSAQDLSYKIGKSWTLLMKVSISLIVEVHGVNGVSEGAVIWVKPILFVSVTDSFLSPKVLKLYNQWLSFKKSLKNIRKMYQTSFPAIRNFVLTFFVLMTWQMREKQEV